MHFFSRKKRLFFAFFFLIAVSCLGLFFAKDTLCRFFLQALLRRAFPQAWIELNAVKVQPGRLHIGGLAVFSGGGHPSLKHRRIARQSFSGGHPIFRLEDVHARARLSLKNGVPEITGEFLTAAVVFRRGRAEHLEGRFRVRPDVLFIDEAGVAAFGGKVFCRGSVFFAGGPPATTLDLHLENIKAEEVLELFDAKKSVAFAGAFGGDISILLKGGNIKDAKGLLHSQSGGRFSVTDSSFISKEVLKKPYTNIMVENLKDYRYDIGTIAVRKEGEDVRADLTLDGEAGRRRLEIIWHGAQL